MTSEMRIAKDFRRDERGVIAIVFALVVTPALALAGAALDYGKAVQAKTQLQRAVDSAALAAAQVPNATQQEKIAIATDFFWANDAANPFGVLGVPVLTVQYVNNVLHVDSRADVNTAFMKLANIGTIQVKASSSVTAITEATEGESKRACLLTTDTTSDKSIKLNGAAQVKADCGVYSNSSSSSALFAQHDTTVESTFTCLVGNYQAEDGQHFNPLPTAGCPVMQDPFQTLVKPSNATAKCTNPKNSQTTYTPGVYCSITISSNSTVSFDPGIYVINKGQFNIGSNATVRITPGKENTGIKGVFFYMAGGNSTFNFGSNALINLRAPAEGTYKGMLLWNDDANASDHQFGAHSSSVLQGAIYSPRTALQMTSSGMVGAYGDWSIWVLKRLELSSSSSLRIKSNYDSSVTPLPTLIQNGGLMHEIRQGESKVTGARLTK